MGQLGMKINRRERDPSGLISALVAGFRTHFRQLPGDLQHIFQRY